MSKKTKRVIVSNIQQTESIDGYDTNSLTFVLSGTHVEHVFSNTIVRTIDSLVGSFAYEEQNVTISKDTSIHNPDYIKRRIANTPIICSDIMPEDFAEKCVQLEIDYIDKPDEQLTDIELMEKRNKDKISRINNIHMTVEAKNDTNDIICVNSTEQYTTFYKDGNIIPSFYPRPITILYLKPGQEIKFSAEASFNIPKFHTAFSSVSVVSHEYSDNAYTVHLESRRQMTEVEIIKQACNIIILKLNNLKKKILDILKANKKIDDIEYKGLIKIPRENHTMGEIFAKRACHHDSADAITFRQDHPDNTFIFVDYNVAGMTMSKITETVIEQLKEDYLTVRNAF